MCRLKVYYCPPGAVASEAKCLTMEPCKTVGEVVRLAAFLADIPEMVGCVIEQKVPGIGWVILEDESEVA
jgi:hypothetical protein